MGMLQTVGLFVVTAVAEILGCYLPYLWLRRGGPWWYTVPAAVSLAAFAWLLSLHPAAAGRTYASYSAVYVSVAVVWLWVVDGQRPTVTDIIGAMVTLAGMLIIVVGARS